MKRVFVVVVVVCEGKSTSDFLPGLTDAMTTRSCLQVILGVEVAVHEDDRVRSSQVHPHSPYTAATGEQARLRQRGELTKPGVDARMYVRAFRRERKGTRSGFSPRLI